MIKFIIGFIIGTVLGLLTQYLAKRLRKKRVLQKVSEAEPPRATIAPIDKEAIVKKYAPIIDELRKSNASDEKLQQVYANMNAEIKEKITWSEAITPKPEDPPKVASYEESKEAIKKKYQVLLAKAAPGQRTQLRNDMREEIKKINRHATN